jgi:enoyl-CoA hydratase/carnithine racemase
LLLTGEMISGTEAEEWGLVTRALSPETFERGVEATVTRLRSRSRDALATVKRMLAETSDLRLDEAILIERRLVSEYRRASRDGLKGLEAFRKKR